MTLTLDNSLVEDHGILCDILMDKYGTLTPSSETYPHLWPFKWLETLYVITTLTLDNSLVEDHGILCDILMDMYDTLPIHHPLHTRHSSSHALSLPAPILPAK